MRSLTGQAWIKYYIIAKADVRSRNSGYKLNKFRFRREIGRNWFRDRVGND